VFEQKAPSLQRRLQLLGREVKLAQIDEVNLEVVKDLAGGAFAEEEDLMPGSLVVPTLDHDADHEHWLKRQVMLSGPQLSSVL